MRELSDLLHIPSVEGLPATNMPFGEGPAAALARMLDLAGRLGLSVKNYDNFIGAVDLGEKSAKLDILTHLDVVPAGDDWTVTKPFVPLIRDGKIYGRGAADDKGPAIAALYALKSLKDLGAPLNGRVRLLLGTNEEDGSRDIKYYYQQEEEAPMTFSPDAFFPVVNTEKGRYCSGFQSQWSADETLPCVTEISGGTVSNIVPRTASALLRGISAKSTEEFCRTVSEVTGIRFAVSEAAGIVRVEATGRSAHASTPENGNNAVTGLLELLTKMPLSPSEGFRKLCAVSAMFPHGDWYGKALGISAHDGVSGNLTMSLTVFHYTLSSLSGVFDCRTPVCAEESDYACKTEKHLSALKAELVNRRLSRAHHVPDDTPLVRTLLKCYEQYSGRPGKCISMGGGTYVHSLKNGVGFGCLMPGRKDTMHGPDEYAVVNDLVMSAEIFAQAILDLCGE